MYLVPCPIVASEGLLNAFRARRHSHGQIGIDGRGMASDQLRPIAHAAENGSTFFVKGAVPTMSFIQTPEELMHG